MKRFVHIFILLAASLLAASCIQEKLEAPDQLPDGTPVTVWIPFGAEDAADVVVGTKAEASRVDESRIHDLYVMIFDISGNKFYGRYFTYEHMATLSSLSTTANEGWYVDNVGTNDDAEKTTKGVVKISTVAQTGCTLVVIGNLENAVTNLDGEAPVDRLTEITTLNELKAVKVQLQQNVINRDDLFLMLGLEENVSTSSLKWYTGDTPDYTTPNYNDACKISLNRIDAKVKFRIKVNTTNIASIEPRYWQVFNVPSSCYLYPNTSDPSGEDRFYFDTEETYFEGTETDTNGTWQVFSFYMLENRQTAKKTANAYYLREKQDKISTGESIGVIYENGVWLYAPDNGTYVKFDVVLTLTPAGITAIKEGGGSALTTDAIFTVHLGDFTSSDSGEGHDYDNYDTERNHAYSYDITIDNSNSIYVEVTDEDRTTEPEAGQEGSLLFATDEIVQCDAHYEYHSMTFQYNASLDKSKISWDVKTPFGEGGGNWVPDDPNNPAGDGQWEIDDTAIDYEWVKFALNESSDGENYDDIRQGYPGDSHYDKSWTPKSTGDRPALLNIHQLILYIFDQTEKAQHNDNVNYPNDFKNGEIKMTAFVNEYYYEKDPRTKTVNPDLWREFVNAKPRELHILSDASVSADGQSDIVNSSHSIIQQSIQTIYNISSPFLSSIWGTEHIDEMRNRGAEDVTNNVNCGWKWSGNEVLPDKTYCNDIENGRYNTAGLWGLNPSGIERYWNKYLKYKVTNATPELRDGTDGGDNNTNYQLMVYSCMTRNRDNDGDGVIDPEEVRWYLASLNQVTGLWVGNEALSPSARVYQPKDASSTSGYLWRSHVVTSTCLASSSQPRVLVAEEGTSLYNYPSNSSWNALGDGSYLEEDWNKIQSVRCVRNIGTFQENGKTKDISYAPFSVKPDLYYESESGFDSDGHIIAGEDGTYTIRFDNLSTKSIREYTEEDLPYHDEYSAHNRVYLELDIQDPDNHTTISPKQTVTDINNNISTKGYNEYCPTGYRLPNMTELALMRALLPSSFWKDNGNGTARPTRTYFSKGYLGSKYDSEKEKIGWVYNCASDYINLTEYNNKTIDGVRCVRDNNVTGDISGKLILSKNRLFASETTRITFNFTSSASPFTEASLALCYTDANGNEKELSIPTDGLDFYAMNLDDAIDYTIPSDLPTRGYMSFRVTLRNAANQVKTFSTPVQILSEVQTIVKLLPCTYDSSVENPPFPVLIGAFSEDANITAWRLRVVSPDNEISYLTLPVLDGTQKECSTIYNYEYGDDTDLQEGTYTFQLEATCNDVIFTSETATMEILKKAYQPNVEPSEGYWKNASYYTVQWPRQQINDLNFSNGDFIETDMDVSKCIYKVATEGANNSTNNMGLDNLLSIGLTAIDWSPDVLHLYYPAIETNNTSIQWIFIRPTDFNGVNYAVQDSADPLYFRLDKDGIYWNNQKINFNRWVSQHREAIESLFEKFIASSTLSIGSVEGPHRSRALYHFVRVVHNGSSIEVPRWDGDIDTDPINGGNL